MKTCAAAAVLCILVSASAFAQAGSALLSDTHLRAGDSDLVRAAKISVAARLALGLHSSTLIDNDTLRLLSGHLSTSSSPAYLPDSASYPQAAAPAPPEYNGPSPAQRAQIQQRIDNLQREQAIMAHESEQPWSDEIDEDRVEQRMTQIPQELNQAQQQLNPQPQPAPPPNNPPQQ
ncbi:MAG TPA: hypothetical protein VL284_09860 [Thermoanaerobaculia bacterium]|nr:hypothetical protein [Thermoanaerobaculia bacterium]